MSTDAPPQQYCSRCLTSFATDLDECPNRSCRKKRPAEGWGRILRAGDVLDRTYRVHQMLAVGGALALWPALAGAQRGTARVARCEPAQRVRAVRFDGDPRLDRPVLATRLVPRAPSLVAGQLRPSTLPC